MSNPSHEHFKAIDYLWGYLRYTQDFKLRYYLNNQQQDLKLLQSTIHLVGSVDSDWGGDYSNRKSTTGFIFTLEKEKDFTSAISWQSKLQKTVALSSCEAEYMAYKEAFKESLFLNSFIKELPNYIQKIFKDLNRINTDSKSAIDLAKNPIHHSRTKHVDIHYHFIKEKIES